MAILGLTHKAWRWFIEHCAPRGKNIDRCATDKGIV